MMAVISDIVKYHSRHSVASMYFSYILIVFGRKKVLYNLLLNLLKIVVIIIMIVIA